MNDALMPIEVALKICRRRWLCQGRCGETGSSVGSRWQTHPRDAAEDVAHVGEEDAADEDESEHARPCSDVELDVQADGDSGQERGEEVGALDRARRELALCAALDRYCRMLMALARVAEDEVDAGLRRAGERRQLRPLRAARTARGRRRTVKTRQTQYRLKSHPMASHSRPRQLLPRSLMACRILSRCTSCVICRSIFCIALTSSSRLLRCVAAGDVVVHRERSDWPAADSASRAAEPRARASERLRCWRSRRVRARARSACVIAESVTGSLRARRNCVSLGEGEPGAKRRERGRTSRRPSATRTPPTPC